MIFQMNESKPVILFTAALVYTLAVEEPAYYLFTAILIIIALICQERNDRCL
jgi:hypothetical protein